MTSAPRCLLDSRTLLLGHLDGLSGAEVGIVGDAAHRGGYHCGRDRLVSNDYSNRHARDRAGLSDYASALDVGQFRHVVGGKAHNLRTFSAWVVAQCRANTPDSRDIREVIYSTDGRTVRRWDRLGTSGTGDDSHLYHTHISVFRDATKAGRGLVPLFTRYLTEIGSLAGPAPTTPEVPTVFRIKANDNAARYLSNGVHIPSGAIDDKLEAAGIKLVTVDTTAQLQSLLPQTATTGQVAALAAAVGQVDEAVLAGLTTALVPAIVAAVTDAVDDVPQDVLTGAVETGVRNVLGGLNDAPAGS